MTRCRALWMIALVSACSSKKEDKAPPPPPPPPPAAPVTTAPSPPQPPDASCTDRVTKLDKRLHELAAATPGFMPIVQLSAPDSNAGKPFTTRGFVIAVTKDKKLWVQGTQLESVKHAAEILDAWNKRALEKWILNGGNGSDAKFPLYIWADRDAPAGTIAELLATAKQAGEHWAPGLVVGGKTAPPSDPAPSAAVAAIAGKLPANEPDATKYLVDQLKASMGACKPMIMALGTADLEGVPDRETEKLATDIPKGLSVCRCSIPNADVFEWGMHVWFGSWAPALAWIDMPKLAAGDKRPIGKLVK